MRRMLRRVLRAASASASVAATNAATQMHPGTQRTSPSSTASSAWWARFVSSSACMFAKHNNKNKTALKKAKTKQKRNAAAAKAKAAAAAAAAEDANQRRLERRSARRRQRQDLKKHIHLHHDDDDGFSTRGFSASHTSRNTRHGTRGRDRARHLFDDELFNSTYEKLLRDVLGGSGGGGSNNQGVRYKHRPGGNPNKKRSKQKEGGARASAFAFTREEMENIIFNENFTFFDGRGRGHFVFVEQMDGFYDGEFTRHPWGEPEPGDWGASSKNQQRRDHNKERQQAREEGNAHSNLHEEEEDFDWKLFEEFVFGGQGGPQFRQHGQQQQRWQHQQQRRQQQPSQRGGGGSVSSPSCPDCAALGILPGAALSEKVLKDSLRTQAIKWHPDRHQSVEDKAKAEVKFKRVYTAYDTLLAKL